MAYYCCTSYQPRDDEELQNSIDVDNYIIKDIPKSPMVSYSGSKLKTKNTNFIHKNQNYIKSNMNWIEIQSFKLYYNSKKYIDCLYIKNKNCKDTKKIIFFSQSKYSNLVTTLPFLLNLSNYLKINILTYEYTNRTKKEKCYSDVNIVFCYLKKINNIKEIILMGVSTGNAVNMNIITAKMNSIKKIKAFILISPTWIFNIHLIRYVRHSEKFKDNLDYFFNTVNKEKISVFIIHGKKDTNIKYFLSLSLSERINQLSEWYPKNGTHLKILVDCRTKLLKKLKNFFNNNYTLTTTKKKVKINFDELDSDSENSECETGEYFKFDLIETDLKNFIDEENEIINEKNIIYGEEINNLEISFRDGDIAPSFYDKPQMENFQEEEDLFSNFTFKNK